MKALGLLVIAFTEMLDLILQAYSMLILVAVLLSWVRPDPYNPIVRVIRQLTEPLFYHARRLVPNALRNTGLDLSPLIIFFAIILIRRVGITLLVDLGLRLKGM